MKIFIKYRFINFLENTLDVHLFPDELYLRAIYYLSFKKELDLQNPRLFTEKIQWLKLNGNYKELAKITDKYEAKSIIADKIGQFHIVPTLGVWNDVQKIEWESLPERFVIKCTHDSGSTIVCKDKSIFDINKACVQLYKKMNRNYFYAGREPNYNGIVPRILAEPYMEDNSGQLLDYKLFCFNGKVKLFKIDFDRFTHHQANYYDSDGKLLLLEEVNYPRNPLKRNPFPEKLKEMIKIAEKLAENFIFMRVDLYCVNGHIYFGEMTPFPGSGFLRYAPDNWDLIMGNWLVF